MRWLLWLFLGFIFWLNSRSQPQLTDPLIQFRCRQCGGQLQATIVTDHFGQVLYQRDPPYLEPG